MKRSSLEGDKPAAPFGFRAVRDVVMSTLQTSGRHAAGSAPHSLANSKCRLAGIHPLSQRGLPPADLGGTGEAVRTQRRGPLSGQDSGSGSRQAGRETPRFLDQCQVTLKSFVKPAMLSERFATSAKQKPPEVQVETLPIA